MREFLAAWGVNQRISSAYHPHANTRAKVGVKSMKRLVQDNTGYNGMLRTNKFYWNIGTLLTEIPNCHQRKWSLDDQSKISFP